MIGMRKLLGAVVLAAALVACSSTSPSDIERYYDPNGLFSAQLPAPNDVLVVPPQEVHGSPALLSAVLSLPPQPSPQASGVPFGGGGSFAQSNVQQDNA